jgi:hypothetical protein
MEKECITCKKTLIGKQTKFCSTKCKNSFTNNKYQNYITQQRRGFERKTRLVNLKGGSCELCGYCKNLSALCFHHIKPSTKSFQIDIRQCSNNSWDKLIVEANKCQLLCLNCHAETHNPVFST